MILFANFGKLFMLFLGGRGGEGRGGEKEGGREGQEERKKERKEEKVFTQSYFEPPSPDVLLE